MDRLNQDVTKIADVIRNLRKWIDIPSVLPEMDDLEHLKKSLEGFTNFREEAARRVLRDVTGLFPPRARTDMERDQTVIRMLDDDISRLTGRIKELTAARVVVTAVKLAEDISRFNAGLREQIQFFDLSAHAASVYKLELAGASAIQLASTRALLDNLDALEKQKAAMERGRAVFDSVRTPQEIFAADFKELNNLLTRGAINWETYERAVAKAAGALAAVETAAPTAIEAGTAAAVAAQVRFNLPERDGLAGAIRQAIEQQKTALREQITAIKDINKTLGELIEAVAGV